VTGSIPGSITEPRQNLKGRPSSNRKWRRERAEDHCDQRQVVALGREPFRKHRFRRVPRLQQRFRTNRDSLFAVRPDMDQPTAELPRRFGHRYFEHTRQIREIYKLDAAGTFPAILRPRLDPPAYLLYAFDLKH